MATLERQHEASGPLETLIQTSPMISLESTSRATLEDCVLLSPSITETVGTWFQAELENRGSGWRVVVLQIRDTTGCVPAEMAEAAVAAYNSYYQAIPQFWDPPDPLHPLLEDVLAEPRLTSLQELLTEHADSGIAFRSFPTTHPEVIEVRSTTEVVVLDCYEPDASDGLYDLTTGQRLPDEPEIRPGQRNLRSAVMVFEDGRWKASDFQGQVDFECEFAPTDRGLPSV